MDGMIWSKQGKQWLDNLKKYENSDYHVVGVYFDGNTLHISEQSATADQGKNEHKRQNSVQIEMEGVWKGVRDFYVPMSRMDFQCGEGYTYRNIFSDYLSHAAVEIRKRIPEKTLIMAVSCPERDAWKRDADEYIMLLENAFGTSENGNIFPMLISLPAACESQSMRCGTMLYVSVEKEWTEFVQLKDGKIIRKTAVSFGYQKGQAITQPISLRINDYVNGSTTKWSGITFHSWEEGFAEILQNVQNAWGINKMDIAIVCSDEIDSIIHKHLSFIEDCTIKRISDPAECVARFVGRQLSEFGMPEKNAVQKLSSNIRKPSDKSGLWEL